MDKKNEPLESRGGGVNFFFVSSLVKQKKTFFFHFKFKTKIMHYWLFYYQQI